MLPGSSLLASLSWTLVLLLSSRGLCEQCVLNTDLRPLPWEQSIEDESYRADDILTAQCSQNDCTEYLSSNDDECTVCWNGVNAGNPVVNASTCKCKPTDKSTEDYFTGKCCQYINITKTLITTTQKTVSFKWDLDNVLKQPYYFVFWRMDTQVVHKRKPTICTEKEALLAELDSGKVEYTVCILPQDLAENSTSPIERNQGDCSIIYTKNSVTEAQRVPFIIVVTFMCISVAVIFLLKFLVPVVQVKNEKKNVKKLELDRHI